MATICQIIAKDPPIKIYRIVHAGPKTQAGGLKNGLLSSSYQASYPFIEHNPLRIPNPRKTIELTTIFRQSPLLKVDVLCGPECICMCFYYIFNFFRIATSHACNNW